MIPSRLALALVAGSLLLAACRKPEVTAYRVPKEKDPEPPAAMAATPVPTAEGPALAWTVPATWRPKAANPMRKAGFAIAGDGGVEADMSITSFGGDVGGELANLNRWRGQLQLPPVAEADLATAVTRREFNGLKFGFVDLAGGGATPQRTLGAWTPYGGATWFFKLSGPAPLVEKEKTAFLDFLASVKPTAP